MIGGVVFGIVGKFLGPIMPYLLVANIAITGVIGAMLHFKNIAYDNLVIDAATKIERAETNVKNLEITVADQKISIDILLIEKGESRARIEQQNEFMANLQSSLNDERRKNESYKTRWSKVANARPTLLARLANRATRKRVRFIETITCRRSDCNEDGDTENSGGTTPEAGSSSGN